jgi:hypothetical protein
MNIGQLKKYINGLDDEVEVYVVDDRTMYQAQTNFVAVKGEQRVLFSRASSTRADATRRSDGQTESPE